MARSKQKDDFNAGADLHILRSAWPAVQRAQREFAFRRSPTANISMRINEMGLKGPKNP